MRRRRTRQALIRACLAFALATTAACTERTRAPAPRAADPAGCAPGEEAFNDGDNGLVCRPALTVDARDFGAAGDGVADDTAALQRALDSLPATGGVVQLAPGTYRITATLRLGDATDTRPSTRNGVALRGAGFGVAEGDIRRPEGLRSAATRIVWAGPAGGTMVRIAGPAAGMTIRDLMLDAAGLAATGIDSLRSFDQYVGHVKIARWTGIAIVIRSDSDYRGPTGAGSPREQLWEHVQTVDPGAPTASALQIAPRSGNVNELLFVRCNFERGDSDTSWSVDLGYCDHISFVATMLLRRGSPKGIGVRVSPTARKPDYPQNVTFYGTPMSGGILLNGRWRFLLNHALLFLPYYTADSEPVPPAGANGTVLPRALVAGITDTGIAIGYTHELFRAVESAPVVNPPSNIFSMSGTATVSTIAEPPTTYNRTATRIWIRPAGEWQTDTAGNIGVAFRARAGRVVELVWDSDTAKWWPVGSDQIGAPLLYSSTTASPAAGGTDRETPFAKTFTLPAGTLYLPGTVLRVRASGFYSAAGAVPLEIRTRLGSGVGCIASQTTPRDARGYNWTASCDLVVRTVGASGTVRGAGGLFGLGRAGVVPSWNPAGFGLDTTAPQTVSLSVRWGAPGPASSITLESLTVEVLYPGATG